MRCEDGPLGAPARLPWPISPPERRGAGYSAPRRFGRTVRFPSAGRVGAGIMMQKAAGKEAEGEQGGTIGLKQLKSSETEGGHFTLRSN